MNLIGTIFFEIYFFPMKIYTKTGDDGTSGLADGRRIEKDSLRIKAIGEIDELNAALGVSRLYLKHFDEEMEHFDELLEMVDFLQEKLFVVGADLATASDNVKVPRIATADTAKLEQWIDEMTSKLKPLQHFILPGGNVSAAYLHLARAICRRAERVMVSLKKSEDIANELVIFVNRLSDLLFTMARYANHLSGANEVIWQGK
jgi:cob(I)alamin adenosyltransferase